jgi:hypothetical protein
MFQICYVVQFLYVLCSVICVNKCQPVKLRSSFSETVYSDIQGEPIDKCLKTHKT